VYIQKFKGKDPNLHKSNINEIIGEHNRIETRREIERPD
jgi:hypothetical protein